MVVKTILARKAVNYEQLFDGTKKRIKTFIGKFEEIEIEKVIEMTKDEYEEFKSDLLKDRDFIKENKEITNFLVKEIGTPESTGIIVVTEGFDYPRYTGLTIKEENFHKCSRCGKYFIGEPAISRKDNQSEVCDACGLEEAMEDFGHRVMLEFCRNLQDKANELGLEIIVRAEDGFERKVVPYK